MNTNGINPSDIVLNGNPRIGRNPCAPVASVVVPQDLQNHLSSGRSKNWHIMASGVVSVPHSILNETNP